MVDLKYHGCLDTKYILCRLSKMCVVGQRRIINYIGLGLQLSHRACAWYVLVPSLAPKNEVKKEGSAGDGEGGRSPLCIDRLHSWGP